MKIIKGLYCVFGTVGVLSLTSGNLEIGAASLISSCTIFLLYKYFSYCDRMDQELELLHAEQLIDENGATVFVFGTRCSKSFDLDKFYSKHKERVWIITSTKCVHVIRR